MNAAALLLLPLLAQAVTVVPEAVPAAGDHDVIITLERPAMVRLDARSAAGSGCTLVDHVRGPFARAGQVGKRNCRMDQLLDAGTYKLRVHGTQKAKGQARVTAVEFPELNQPVTRLVPGVTVETRLPEGKQASWWITATKEQAVSLRVAGRTAGMVRVWREGRWLDEAEPSSATQVVRPGQGIQEWWLDRVMEPGDYLVVVYGTSPVEWSRGQDADDLTVSLAAPAGPPERGVAATIPASGYQAWRIPDGAAMAVLAVQGNPRLPVTLGLSSLSLEGVGLSSAESNCVVAPAALVRECAVRSHANRNAAWIRGEPGTNVEVRWVPWGWSESNLDGFHDSPRQSAMFRPAHSGNHLVATHDVPADRDSAPLACLLRPVVNGVPGDPIAADFLQVSPGRPFERAFNYNASGETVWFEITEWGRYRVTTSGQRKSRCSLVKLTGNKAEVVVDPAPEAVTCDATKLLTAGRYELKLYGGVEGIERLRIAKEGFLFNTEATGETAAKTTCQITGVSLSSGGLYELVFNRSGNAVARGLYVRRLPLAFDQALPVQLEPGATAKLALGPGTVIQAASVGGVPFKCAMQGGGAADAATGRCVLPATQTGDTIILENPGKSSITVSVVRPTPRSISPALASYSPTPPVLPVLEPGKTLFFDYGREEARSLLFDVKDAGLYHVTTLGLLTTRCTIRTPLVTRLADDVRGGRGHNCLVQGYLRPGRYLLTVRTEGLSRGRTGVTLTRRSVKTMAAVNADGEAFFRAEAGDLVQQKLTVKRSASHVLGTTAQNASFQCRLDDTDGWPVMPVPMACERTGWLEKGSYLWTQMPLTVESMRRTQLQRVKESVVLAGNKAHTLALNTPYNAQLGKDGKDEFNFDMAADAPVDIELTAGMQGRLYDVADAKNPRPVEVIAPQEMPPEPTDEPPAEEAPPDEGMAEYSGESEGGETYSEGDSGEGEGSEEAPAPAPRYAPRAPPPPMPAKPRGQRVDLPAGRYKLVAEHARGDVNIAYRVTVASQQLMPGVKRELTVPGEYALRMQTAGVLQFRSEGSTDVRCRLFDATGRLVAESADQGADWNCALAEPMVAGVYRLVLESQTLQPGTTTIHVGSPRVEELATLADGTALKLAGQVVTHLVQPPAGDVVQEYVFSAPAAFSCAVEDAGGRVLLRSADVKECVVPLRIVAPVRLRLWTLGSGTTVKALVSTKNVVAWAGGTVPAGSAVRAEVTRAGRFRTAARAYCLEDNARGLMRNCGPAASLDVGKVTWAVPGKAEGRLDLAEEALSSTTATTRRLTLAELRWIQRVTAPAASLFLVQARTPPGEPAEPACAVGGGARELRDQSCAAVSGVATDAVVRLWSARPVQADWTWSSVPFPSDTRPLDAGQGFVTWKGDAARYSMPKEAWRLGAVVPSNTWAIALDSTGRALDVCAPATGMMDCRLEGTGGDVVFVGEAGSRAEYSLVRLPAAARVVTLDSLLEERSRRAGIARANISPVSAARQVTVEGDARCMLRRDDGVRVPSCSAPLPENVGAVLEIEHGRGPWRALVHAPGALQRARLGTAPAAGRSPAAMPPAHALALAGATLERLLTVDKEAVVHLRSDSGVCALWSGNEPISVEGLDGCAVDRLLGPGSYRWVVRPFAGEPTAGLASWTAEPVETLADGVGAERFIGPGETRLYRFRTASAGRIGLGLQVPGETLECRVLDAAHRPLGEGCQQYLALEAGTYVLSIQAPSSAKATRFRPVLLGLAGAKMAVPDDYVRDFFQRIGGQP
ncbi:MAG: hypothetical protein HY904_04865 [Deltaproteobacteria bacterium]|nr:hypothetical protein [Deltaproteobacteria bacterium]